MDRFLNIINPKFTEKHPCRVLHEETAYQFMLNCRSAFPLKSVLFYFHSHHKNTCFQEQLISNQSLC